MPVLVGGLRVWLLRKNLADYSDSHTTGRPRGRSQARTRAQGQNAQFLESLLLPSFHLIKFSRLTERFSDLRWHVVLIVLC